MNNYKGRIRRLDPSGIVQTVAGGGTDNEADDQDLGDGEPALEAEFSVPYGLALGPDGSLYFALPNEGIVERLSTDGRLRRVAGNSAGGWAVPEYGPPAVDVNIGHPTNVVAGLDGRVYVRHDQPAAASDVLISEILPDGGLAPIAGHVRGQCGYSASQDGEAARRTCIGGGNSLFVDPDGTLHYGDGREQVRRIQPALSGFGPASFAVPASDGAEVWEFDDRGRHLRTVDGITGKAVRRFEYDGAGRLSAAIDRDGNRTTIDRAADGTPQAVVAPGGQRTTLALDAQGWLSRIGNPAGEDTLLAYHDGGLLKSVTKPGGGTSKLTYDAAGRLVEDVDPDGVVTKLDRTEREGDVRVAVTVGTRTTTYRTQVLDNGDRRREIVEPGGRTTELLVHPDGTQVRTTPDGTKTTVEPANDPRWGNRVIVPAKRTVRTPGGKERVEVFSRSVDLTDESDPFSVERLSVDTENGDFGERRDWTYTAAQDGAPAQIRTRSAEDRETVTVLDAKGRVSEVSTGQLPSFDDVTPIKFGYDAAGRLTDTSQGTTRTAFTYDAKHRVSRRTDAEGGFV